MAAKRHTRPPIGLYILLVLALMALSFIGGMLTHRVISKPTPVDAGLEEIEEIPILTDLLATGCRARPGEKREIKYIVIHETDNPSPGANAAAHNAFLHNNANVESGIVSWHYTVDDHEIYHHLPDDENAYHAGDGMGKNSGNLNGIGIELCVNEGGNFEQTLIHAERLCARLLVEYDLKPSALRKHQDFSGKECPATIIASGRWDEFCSAVDRRYRELKDAAEQQEKDK